MKPAPLQTDAASTQPPAPTLPPREVRKPRGQSRKTAHPDAAAAWPPAPPGKAWRELPSAFALASATPPPKAPRRRSPTCPAFLPEPKQLPSVSTSLDTSPKSPKQDAEILP